jgi:hypothetical protein
MLRAELNTYILQRRNDASDRHQIDAMFLHSECNGSRTTDAANKVALCQHQEVVAGEQAKAAQDAIRLHRCPDTVGDRRLAILLGHTCRTCAPAFAGAADHRVAGRTLGNMLHVDAEQVPSVHLQLEEQGYWSSLH